MRIRGRFYLEWFGRIVAEFDGEIERPDDGVRAVAPTGPTEPLPVQVGVSGLADTALGDQADPDTRVSGFGLPLRRDETGRRSR